MPSKLRLRGWDVLYQRAARMEGADAEIRAALSAHVPPIVSRVWTDAAALERAQTRMDRAALAGTRTRSSARSTTLDGATSPRIDVDPRVVEHGDGHQTQETYTRRYRAGAAHRVTRNTQAQLPARNRRGRVVRPALREATARVMSAYAQTVKRTLDEILGGK